VGTCTAGAGVSLGHGVFSGRGTAVVFRVYAAIYGISRVNAADRPTPKRPGIDDRARRHLFCLQRSRDPDRPGTLCPIAHGAGGCQLAGATHLAVRRAHHIGNAGLFPNNQWASSGKLVLARPKATRGRKHLPPQSKLWQRVLFSPGLNQKPGIVLDGGSCTPPSAAHVRCLTQPRADRPFACGHGGLAGI
jgi:hypothetical protein